MESYDTLPCLNFFFFLKPKKELKDEVETLNFLSKECDLYLISKVKNDQEEEEIKENLKFFNQDVRFFKNLNLKKNREFYFVKQL